MTDVTTKIKHAIARCNGGDTRAERINALIELFAYLEAIPDFMRRQVDFRRVISSKLSEFVCDGLPVVEANRMARFLANCENPVSTVISYSHPLWPSPRAVLLVRKMIERSLVPVHKRLTHAAAIQILADWAQITVPELLSMTLQEYVDRGGVALLKVDGR